MKISLIKPEHDGPLADMIRSNLKKYSLDIPGTAYFDDNLNHLSEFYLAGPQKRYYYVATGDNDEVIGGIGLAEIDLFDRCCELQKLYIKDSAKGRGLSYKLVSMIEDKARELGYKRMYLETHDNLMTAIRVYEKTGYREIDKPEGIVHATMNRFFIKEL